MGHRTKVAVVNREQKEDFQSAVVLHHSVPESVFEEAGMDLVGELVESLRHIEVVLFGMVAEIADLAVKNAVLGVGTADLVGGTAALVVGTAVQAAGKVDLGGKTVGLEEEIADLEADTVGLVVGIAVAEAGIAVLQVAEIVEAVQKAGY